MSTSATTPNPDTMPLGDLKTAAGLNGAPAPEPAAVPNPPAPEWGQINKAEDGTYQVTLATGEVFKGTADEVIAKQAESQVNTKRWGQEWKQKFESAQPPAVTPAAPAAPPEDPAEVATRQWMLEQFAKGLGLSGAEELQARMGMISQTSEQMATNIALADFHKMCPGYVDTPENSGILAEYIGDIDHFPTAKELKSAYAEAVLDGKIVPQVAASAPAAPRPAPMPTTTGGTPSAGGNEWNIPLDQLKKAAGLG